MSLEVVRTLPRSVWSQFVLDHPKGNIFHTPEMFEVFRRTRNHHAELWATTCRDKVLALFLPVQVSVFDGWGRALSTRAIVYGGALSSPGAEGDAALSELLRQYTARWRTMAMFTEIRNVGDSADQQEVLLGRGFRYEEHLNFLVDLESGSECVFSHIGSRTRKNIRRGLNRGRVLIEETDTPEGVAECYSLLGATYLRARVPLADHSLFDAAREVLRPPGMVRFTVARVSGAVAAASVDLIYKDVVYGWYGGTERRFASEVPNELLTWRLLEWAAKCGYRTYDFGGAGRPDEAYPVRDFKAKFGGRLVSYGRNTRIHSRWRLAAAEMGYRAYRRFVLGKGGAPSSTETPGEQDEARDEA